ncbi:MAG TPA: hypothetical protein VKQ36_05610 [Ktedonobacterales bacterium]|nr:hypothetical protein [Ktedonobacterales bacterium]
MDQQNPLDGQGSSYGNPDQRDATPSTSSTALAPAGTGAPAQSGTPDVGSAIRDTLQQAQQRTLQTVDAARQQAMGQLNAQVNRQLNQTSQGLAAVSDAASLASQRLRESNQGTLADYVDLASDRIDQAASYLRKSTLSDLATDAKRLVEQQPLLFVAGAFALGLLGARFLKSTSQRSGSSQG